VYRYGGAEFVVTLPEKNQQQAEQIKDQLLKRIGEAASTVLNQPKGALNIHYGIAMLDPTAYIEQLIDQCARSTYIFDFNANSPNADS
jgi:GGDEF domain-containing protein